MLMNLKELTEYITIEVENILITERTISKDRIEIKDSFDIVIAYLDYEEAYGKPYVDFVFVNKNSRGKGLGKQLMKTLQNLYPNIEIDHGYKTADGGRLYKSLKHKIIINKSYIKLEKKIKQYRKMQSTEIANNFKNGELWNDLEDKIDYLEKLLYSMKKETKLII